jgi:polyferredoxin
MSTRSAAWDLLRAPVIGPFLRWRHARTMLQTAVLIIAAIEVLHGLLGPPVAPANLATVLTWVHYRGLLVFALLVAGNVFCTGCPLVLVRNLARRLHLPARRWPRALRTKWIALALFVLVLFAYELFDLWALPRATAWIIVGYFAAALAIDLVFSGASFCQYVCPIGQFNFIASTMSPFEVEVREPATCRTCRTADCVKGRRDQSMPLHVIQRGCELGLFLPAKVGNLDCTACLECVHACPHDNVAVSARLPGAELLEPGWRSIIGRLADRPDIAMFALLFAFAGMVNAFGMIAPAHSVEARVAALMGVSSEAPVLAVIFFAALILVPGLLVGGAAISTPRSAASGWWRTAVTYSYALVPFGFGMWLSHYGFHLLTGVLTIVPVTQSAALDLFGWPMLGAPRWGWTGMRPGAVFPIQVGFILVGTISAIGIAYLISEREHPDRPTRATLPWAAVITLMTVAALWILAQPMDMRGVGLGVGG